MHIHELTILTRSPQAQADFYERVLDLPIAKIRGGLVVMVGATRLVFRESATKAGNYHFAFNIPQNLFRACKEWIAQRVPLLADASGATEFLFTDWNAHAFYFTDADGNIVECIARHRLQNNANPPFKSQYLLSVSEIGLPTHDVLRTVNLLTHHLPLAVWRGKGSESFTAVGDEEGLFIIVHAGHAWLPTADVSAVPMETKIVVQGWTDYDFFGLPYSIRGTASVPLED